MTVCGGVGCSSVCGGGVHATVIKEIMKLKGNGRGEWEGVGEGRAGSGNDVNTVLVCRNTPKIVK